MRIRKLTIEHYRGLKHLEWLPAPGLNCLVGPADTGKSTVLSAVALLFNQRQSPSCSDFDFFKRKTSDGLRIEAVLAGVPEGALGSVPVLHGWKEDKLVALPDESDAEPVVVVRVSAGEELELTYEILEYGGGTRRYSVGVRRDLPFARLTAWEYGSRELRLGYGSLLMKSLDASDLKAAIHEAAAEVTSQLDVPKSIRKKLDDLKVKFREAGLPSDLALGLIAPPDSSLSAMFGLMVGDVPEQAIPLVYAGTGTRQSALFTLVAALTESPAPLVVLDEPEIGLEPYRQRGLVARLRKILGSGGQAIVATHSSHVLNCMKTNEIWRLGSDGSPQSLDKKGLASIHKRAPDAFISAIPVVAEGDTEAGFLEAVLDARCVAERDCDLATKGVRIVRGKSHLETLEEAESLLAAGFDVGVFVDNEDSHAGKRKALQQNAHCVMGLWPPEVKSIEYAVATWLPWKMLEELLDLAAGLNEKSKESLYQQITSRLGEQSKESLQEVRSRGVLETSLRSALGAAMHECKWFKSLDKSRELGRFLLKMELPEKMEEVIARFWKGIISRL